MYLQRDSNNRRSTISYAFAAFALAGLIGVTAFAGVASAAELVVVGSTRCPYCLAWEREIGRSYAKSGEARQAPLRRVDIEDGRPGDLAELEDVHVTPTFILVQDGHEIGRIQGYTGAQSFWPGLHGLLSKLHAAG
jgi:hypothetical protein